jgi:hypothetical protein
MGMHILRRLLWAGAASVVAASAMAAAPAALQKDDSKDQEAKRPKVTLKAAPLVGGANDYEDFYCPTVEWDWGDGTQSESTTDCDPYQAGKTEIKRRFTVEHVFRAGNYRVAFRMKRRNRPIVAATANIQVRPGIRDIGGL